MGHSISDRDAKCLRCGAPAGGDRAGELRLLTGFTARRRAGRSRTRARDGRRRIPYGYVHADVAFCARRMPNARRRPQDRQLWGSF